MITAYDIVRNILRTEKSTSLEKARQFAEKARLELSIFPDSPGRKSLEHLVDYVLERNR